MHEIIGWIGAFLYIIAYLLVSIKKNSGGSPHLSALKYFRRCLFDREFIHQSDYPSVFTNGVWAAIGVFAIYYNKRK